MKNLIEYVKSTSYGTRSFVLVLLSIVLLVVEWVTGAHWVGILADLSFWASMFFWGADWLEKKYCNEEDCDCETVVS